MISVHNVPYALKCIRDIFSKQIPGPLGFSQPGHFKEESASGVGKAPPAASERKCLAGESSAQQVEVGQVVGVDGSGVWIVSLLLSDIMDGTVAGLGVFVDLAVADTLKAPGPVQAGPEAADPSEHVEITDQVISSPS